MTSPILIIGIGNPSRGDDALGPLMIERLETLNLAGVELLTDFQLQVEYALDLQGRRRVIFVDAAVNGPEPFSFEPVGPEQDTSYSSHELSPAAVLHTCEKLYGPPPEARILAIRGYRFDLGAPPSPAALANLDAACRRLLAEIA
ncbi:MAG: hydrogenase maturation protease [Hydrogenophilaceae bacterium]